MPSAWRKRLKSGELHTSTKANSRPKKLPLAFPANQDVSYLTKNLANATLREKPPRASLMGIPAELRLRIYEFLFTTDTEPQQPHCCLPKGYNSKTAPPLACSCMPARHPQILSICKLVFNEASPIFYAAVEPRLYLPTLDYTGKPAIHHLKQGIDQLRKSRGSGHISRLLLIGALRLIAIEIGRDDPPRLSLDTPNWNMICSRLMNVRTVRIHLEIDHYFEVEIFDAETLVGLVALPKLRSVQLELWACKQKNKDIKDMMPGSIFGLRSKIASAMKARAKAMEKDLAVNIVLPTGHDNACHCCGSAEQ